jgi:hypothetical protein
MNDRHSEQSGFERIVIAIFLAVLGFLTGLISVWMLTDLPGVETSGGIYLAVAMILGSVCFVIGYKSSDRTVDLLGEIWNTTWKLSLGILSIIRTLSR